MNDDFAHWWNSPAADTFRAAHPDLDGETLRPLWDAARAPFAKDLEPLYTAPPPAQDHPPTQEQIDNSPHAHLGNIPSDYAKPTPSAAIAAAQAGLSVEQLHDLTIAVGELSTAMGSPCVFGKHPATILSATVRLAAHRLIERTASTAGEREGAKAAAEAQPTKDTA